MSSFRLSKQLSKSVRALQQTHFPPSLVGSSTHLFSTNVSDDIRNKRVFNFSAGPACIDTDVMIQAQSEFSNWHDTGMGFIEMSHRDAGGPVQTCISESTNLVRELLDVPDDYHVFFMHGGAHAQFASIPLNLSSNNDNKFAGYVNTGFWSQRAMNEASKFIKTKIIANAEDYNNYSKIPPINDWNLNNCENMEYIHICANETIHGLEFLEDPTLPSNAPPLIGDFTSTLFSRPINISKYGVIYASAGKNFGPAGVCMVIAKKSLVKPINERNIKECPGILDWYEFTHSKPIHSIWNTPPVFQIYMTNLTLNKLKNDKLNLLNVHKWIKKRTNKIYDLIDKSDGFYFNGVEKQYRSLMNVPFRIMGNDNKPNIELEKKFTKIAEDDYNMLQLFGHPLFGGQRVTCYNPISDKAIDTVCNYMNDFMKMHMKQY